MRRLGGGALGRLLVLGALVLTGLVGCANTRPPATTEGLLVRYVAHEDVGNVMVDAQTDLVVSALGIRAKIPLLVDLDIADNAAHGTVTVDLSSLKTRPYVMELYAEQADDTIVCYLGEKLKKRPTAWKRWTIDTTVSVDVTTVTELLSVSEFAMIAKDVDEQVAYELMIPLAAVLETTFDIARDPVALAGMDEQSLIDAVGSDKVKVDFTKDCLLRSISAGALFDIKSAETNNLPVRVSVDALVVFDGYGTVDPASVVVPDEVRESAVPTDTPLDPADLLGPDSAFAPLLPE